MKLSENPILRRVFSLAVTFAMLLSMLVVMPVSVSADENQPGGGKSLELLDADYIPDLRNPNYRVSSDDGIMLASLDEDEYVRVSIVVEGSSTISAGFAAKNIADNASAMSYRAGLELKQEDLVARIRGNLGIDIDVVWNLTLAANVISANVRRGDIEAIKTVPGVVDVFEETLYTVDAIESTVNPNMANSPALTGSTVAWAGGYTGAGSRVAIIDTGVDLEHIAFDSDAFLHSYDVNDYDTSLLMTADELEEVYPKLNMSKLGSFTSDMYYSAKIPVAFNYSDGTSDTRHLNNGLDPHGSHVAGIAAANAYIPDGDGGFIDVTTLEDSTSRVKGVAPDAQIFAMQVFRGGGASDSDYIAAIEDAMLLGADVCNLSLGSPNGFAHSDLYDQVFEDVRNSGMILAISIGNEGAFADYLTGALYNDDVSFSLAGSPGTITDSLSVASVNNGGYVEQIITVDSGDTFPIFDSRVDGDNENLKPFYSLGDSVEYIYLRGVGTVEEFNYLKSKNLVQGKVVCIDRGDIDFSTKANNAVEAGAIGVIIVNTYPDSNIQQGGLIRMDLSNYKYTAPVISTTLNGGSVLMSGLRYYYDRDENDEWIYYYAADEGEIALLNVSAHGADFGEQIMSDFSSWGVPGSLELKPDITAPGGMIWSVLGANDDVNGEGIGTEEHNEYIGMGGTSMAAPHIAGMVGVISQYIEKTGLADKLNLTPRVIAQSLLMSTATPIMDPYNSNYYYPVIYQGAGLANVGKAVSADAFIMMAANANDNYDDGKVKVELGDDPSKTGVYDYTFTLTNIGEGTNSYTFNTDLFTQAIEGAYLSKFTAPIPSSVSYKVNNEPYEVVASIDADVDMDGDTDEYDAVAILDYLVGNVDGSKLDLIAADVDSDTEVTSYDAHLILAGLGTRVTLKPGETITVDVHIELNKAALESYVNGAWVEGYTTVSAEASVEGVLDVDYSIPIVGFYGNWTDPSMFDRQTTIEALYGTNDIENYGPANVNVGGMPVPYNGLLTYVDSSNGGTYVISGNPFFDEEEFPADRLAIRSIDKFDQFNYTLIRSASDVVASIRDESGKVIWDKTDVDNKGMLFYSSAGGYQNPYHTQKLKVSPEMAGAEEGDKITVSVTAIPEYYMMNAGHDEATAIELVESGILGKGASLSYTLTVDDTAPVITGAQSSVDPETYGDLSFNVTDNENIAFVAVMRRSESEIYAYDIPATDEFTFTATAEELEGAGEFVLLFAGDYAGNVTAKVVEYGGENADVSGKLIGVNIPERYSGMNYSAWRTFDPDTVKYDYSVGGYVGVDYFAPVSSAPGATVAVAAATYYDGYIFFVGQYEDGTTTALYASPVDEPDLIYLVSDLPEYGADAITALDYSEDFGCIVGLCSRGTYSLIVAIDPLSGEVGGLGMVVAPEVNAPFTSLAITDDGTCYADVPITSTGSHGVIYKFDLLTAYIYAMMNLPCNATPVEVEEENILGGYHSSIVSMAYDSVSNKIYAVEYYSSAYLDVFDIDANTLTRTNPGSPEDYLSAYFASNIPQTYGLCLVPETVESEVIVPTTTATDIAIASNNLELLLGEVYTMKATANPWTLELSDEHGNPISTREVVWTSEDPTIVSANGNVLVGLAQGSTRVIGTSVATPDVSVIVNVTVSSAPAHQVTAFVLDENEETGWVSVDASNPQGYTDILKTDYQIFAGTNSGEGENPGDPQKIFAVTNGAVVEIDPATLTLTGRESAINYQGVYYSDMAEVPYPIGLVFGQPNGNITEYLAIGESGDRLIIGNLDDSGLGYGVPGLSSEFGSPMVGIAFETLAKLNGTDSIGAVYAVICEDGVIHEIILGLTGEYAEGIYTGVNEYDTGIENPGAGDFFGSNRTQISATGTLYHSDGADLSSSDDDFSTPFTTKKPIPIPRCSITSSLTKRRAKLMYPPTPQASEMAYTL